MVKPSGERIASLETWMQGVEKKVDAGFSELKAEIKAIAAKIDESHAQTDARLATFVTHEELKNSAVNLEKQVVDIKAIATRRSWFMGLAGTLAGILLSAVTAIVVAYFSR